MIVSERNSHDLARTLLDRLDLPIQASAVLGHERYWTEELCHLYFEACDEILFDDPAAGLPMARIAPALVQMLPSSRARLDLLVHALAILGDAQRAVGTLLESEGTFRTALVIAARAEVSLLEIADLHRRYSGLLLSQRRTEQALDAATRAVDILKIEAPYGRGDYCLGAALVRRGVAHLHRHAPKLALEDFGLALASLDPVANERTYSAAIQNLARALGQSSELGHLYRAARHLQAAKQALAGRDRCPVGYELLRVEAALLRRLGSAKRAQSNLEIAREGFAHTGKLAEFVLASIDLATLLEELGRLEDLRLLIHDTISTSRALNADIEALSILGTWHRAVESGGVSGRVSEQIRDRFERLRPGMAFTATPPESLGKYRQRGQQNREFSLLSKAPRVMVSPLDPLPRTNSSTP